MALYVVATPIGNLKDISKRALEILDFVDLILAEDTRQTKKLLFHYKIRKKLKRFDEYTSENQIKKILKDLKKGKEIALVSNAGTPVISDPGSKLINKIYEFSEKIKVVPIPGPSAVISALSICGFRGDSFCFLGYPPKKGKKRAIFFKEIISSPKTQVFFSTPHAIIKDLVDLKEAGLNGRDIFVAREMTKMFERFYWGNIEDILTKISQETQKGEYTVVINSK
jgi:16S rRNA (cytidine1402-2'-O)-methyltransferase